MKTLFDDLRYGLRLLASNRGVTLVAVLTLALGIGANATIFTFVNSTLFGPIPFQNIDRTVFVWSTNSSGQAGAKLLASFADYLDWKNTSQSFEQLAAWQRSSTNWTGYEKPERLLCARVSPNFFSVVEAKPVLGRVFTSSDVTSSAEFPVVISPGFWQTRFGGTSDVIGRSLILDGKPHVIVGVVERKFWIPSRQSELWIPMDLNTVNLDRAARTFYVAGLLKQGLTIPTAQTEAATISRGLEETNPTTNTGWSARVLPLYESLLRNESDRTVYVLVLMTVFTVLLIACANVANLLLARGTGRSREVAIRSALGASRTRLIRQLMTESMLLALLGGAAGLILAFWGGDLLLSSMPHNTADPDSIIDVRVFVFTLTISLIAVMAFGLVPALRTSQAHLSRSRRSGRMRSVLVVTQISLTTLLLVISGVLIRAAITFNSMDPGYATSDILTMAMELPQAKYSSDATVGGFYRETLERVKTVGGVENAAVVSPIPVKGGLAVRSFDIEQRPATSPKERPWASAITVSPDYFRTMGIPFVAARGFTDRDVPGAPPVAVVNEFVARHYWAGNDPVGTRIRWNDKSTWITIVAVIKDVRHIHPLREAGPQIYLPYAQNPVRAASLVVRTKVEPAALIADVRNAVWSVDKDQPVYDIATMQELINEDMQGAKTIVSLLVIFAAIALVLATVGIYGVISYSVGQRITEIGIRMALGARRTDVLGMVVREGCLFIAVGLALGLAGGLGVARLMQGLLVGIGNSYLWSFAGPAIVLAAAGIAASYLPARHATRVDPIVALRHE